MKRTSVILSSATVVTLLWTAPVSAQGHPIAGRGLSTQSTYSTGGIDAVNNFNRSLSLAIPLGYFPLSTHSGYGLTLYYSSEVWDLELHTNCNGDGTPCLVAEPEGTSNAGLGWYLSLGRILSPSNPANETNRFVYVGPDGGRHHFYDTLHEGESMTAPCNRSGCATQFSRDGSYLRFKKATMTVEFPDGSVHTFGGPGGELTRIQDPFGNWMNVAVTAGSWTLSDQFGRFHVVTFATIAGRQQVVTVDFAAFGGTRAVYAFDYEENVPIYRPYMDSDDLNSDQVTVALLSSVSGPEGLAYTMAESGSAAYYRGNPGTNDPTGQIRLLQLPTRGTLEWTYDQTHYPVNSSWAHFENGFGVSSKTTGDAWGPSGTWTYSSTLYPPGSPTELQTTVVDPATNRRVHYFATPTETSPSGWTGWEYGLPFTSRVSEGGKLLSSEVYNSTGSLVRSSWLAFSHDQLSASAGPGHWYNSNRRVIAERTKFDDDSGRYADRVLSSFDGLGHYRDTHLQGNFDTPTARTESAQFNPGRGCYDIDLSTNSQLCTGANAFVPIANGEKWILGMLGYTQQTEGGSTARQELSFDSETGFLGCLRVLKSGTARSANDVVITFGNDGAGNVSFEKSFGGDRQTLATGSVCDTAASPAYWIEHGYASGSLASTRYKDSGGTPVTFYSFQAAIDNNTGLVADSYDESGFWTRFTYDRLSRLTVIEPKGASAGEMEATTTMAFSNPSGSTAAKISLTRTCPSGVTCSPSSVFSEAEVSLDGFGRTWRERVRRADGTNWARRETSYNALGWKTGFSEFGSDSGSLPGSTLSGFDAFGRPGRLTKPDGKMVNFFYTGVRELTRQTRVQTSLGEKETFTSTTEGYDALGRLRRVWEPAMPNGTNVDTNYFYDVGNRIKEVDQVAGTVHQHRYFSFDNRGFLSSESHPEKGGPVTYLGYDARGHAREIQDGASARNLIYSFDAAERLSSITEGGAGGRLLKEFTYGSTGNSRGRLLTAKRHNYFGAPFNTDYLVSETYEYNGIGRRPSKRTTQTTIFGANQERFEQTWTYDRGGSVSTIGYPVCFGGTCPPQGTAPRTVSNSVSNGFLTAIPGWATSISYHPNGMLSTAAFANNISQVVLSDPNGLPRPQEIQYWVSSTGTYIGSLGPYEYDAAGNIKRLNGFGLTYDLVSRLTSGALSVVGVPRTYGIAYDGFGNVTSLTLNGSPRATPTSLSTNRLSSGVYDPAGNLTWWNEASYGYDRLNMPTQVCSSGTFAACTGESWIYAYTADDERILEYRIGGGAFRTSLRDLNGKVLREYRIETVPDWSVFEDFVYRDGTLLASVHPTEGTRWFGPDHLGTPRGVFDAAGSLVAVHTYYPFGEEATAATQDTQQMKFTGHERDLLATPTAVADDTDYMHARQYSALTARFHSFDPAGADPRAPQSWNRYAYVLGNPLRYTDPFGLNADSCDGTLGPCQPIDIDLNWQIDVDGVLPTVIGPANGPNIFPILNPGAPGGGGGGEPMGPGGGLIGPRVDPRCSQVLDDGRTVSQNVREFAQRKAMERAAGGSGSGTGLLWLLSVAPGGPQDYKLLSPSRSQEMGNFNYGATGRVFFGTEMLKNAAGLVQLLTDPGRSEGGWPWGPDPRGDQWGDQMLITEGANAGCMR